MWLARTKIDLIIEVWEKLDCGNVGASEIIAIEEVVGDQYGRHAVDSPMRIARILADEGAELRHSEILGLWVERRSNVPYEPEFRNLAKFSNLTEALTSIRHFENLRRKFLKDGDKQGLRFVREEALSSKKELLDQKAADKRHDPEQAEMAEWITIWLQSPEIFDNWIILRQSSADFAAKFGSHKDRTK